MTASAAVPAAASRAVAPLLEGPLVGATALGETVAGAWLRVGDATIFVGDHTTVRLPNAVVADLSGQVRASPPIVIGDRRVVIAGRVIEVIRWWDPQARVPPWDPAALAGRNRHLAAQVDHAERCPLRCALMAGDGAATLGAARRLVGFGPGLTPAGDDHLAGAMVAFRALATIHERSAGAWIDDLWRQLTPYVRASTTYLSFDLLSHAARGETLPEVTALGAALAGQGGIDRSLRSLSQIGSTSGLEMARGVCDGASAAWAWIRS